MIQTRAAGQNFNALCFQLLEILQCHSAFAGQLCAAVVEQYRLWQFVLLRQRIDKSLHEHGAQRIIAGSHACGRDDNNGIVCLHRRTHNRLFCIFLHLPLRLYANRHHDPIFVAFQLLRLYAIPFLICHFG